MAGKGYERGEQYSHVEIDFLDIDNIHVMRDSLAKFLLALDSDFSEHPIKTSFLMAVEESGWMEHVKAVLLGADRVCRMVTDPEAQRSVLIHCSDGWDRTPQLTSLAMIMADPYYRTIQGFLALLEIQWLGYGHQFPTRIDNSHAYSKELGIKFKADQISPVFLQYIECTWQLMMQFLPAFEFNTTFLLVVMEILTSIEICFISLTEDLHRYTPTYLVLRYLMRTT